MIMLRHSSPEGLRNTINMTRHHEKTGKSQFAEPHNTQHTPTLGVCSLLHDK